VQFLIFCCWTHSNSESESESDEEGNAVRTALAKKALEAIINSVSFSNILYSKALATDELKQQVASAAIAAQVSNLNDVDDDDLPQPAMPEQCDCGREVCGPTCRIQTKESGSSSAVLASKTELSGQWTQPKVIMLVLACLCLAVAFLLRR
jgi:hypothetical protein